MFSPYICLFCPYSYILVPLYFVCHHPDTFFTCRSDPRYKRSLGQTILNLARIIPHGILVFFPSYTVMKDCQEDWQSSGVWSKLSERKVSRNNVMYRLLLGCFHGFTTKWSNVGATFLSVVFSAYLRGAKDEEWVLDSNARVLWENQWSSLQGSMFHGCLPGEGECIVVLSCLCIFVSVYMHPLILHTLQELPTRHWYDRNNTYFPIPFQAPTF